MEHKLRRKMDFKLARNLSLRILKMKTNLNALMLVSRSSKLREDNILIIHFCKLINHKKLLIDIGIIIVIFVIEN
jgi:hypothetical protein